MPQTDGGSITRIDQTTSGGGSVNRVRASSGDPAPETDYSLEKHSEPTHRMHGCARPIFRILHYSRTFQLASGGAIRNRQSGCRADNCPRTSPRNAAP